MKINVDVQVLEKHPNLQTVFILAENLKLRKSEDELRRAFEEVQEEFGNRDNTKEIVEYDKAMSLFGLGNEKSSLEVLDKLVTGGKSLYLGNPIIDAYNLFGFRERLSLGGYDLDRLGDKLILRFVKEGDEFKQLNKDKYVKLDSGVVFADENEVLCNGWISKQSDEQKIRETTKNVLFRIEVRGDSVEAKRVVNEFEKHLSEWFELKNFQYQVLNGKAEEAAFDLSTEALDRRERYRDYSDLLERGVANVLVKDNLMARLIDGEKLRIKHGVDPTGSMLHIGHGVNYIKMREFQKRGHTIVFLIGSFTARLGDPTDKSDSRKLLTVEEVKENAKEYLNMVGRILDIENNIEVVYNGDWYDQMSVDQFIRLMGKTTVARMLERDMFKKRIEEGKGIGLHELVYPLLQGYDSVVLETDLTVIGNDQTFNELQARPLMEDEGMRPQDLIAMDLLVGTDGTQKMGKSLGNFIAFDDAPEDKFGKIMSIPDSAILTYYAVSTMVSREELERVRVQLQDPDLNPRDLKMELAWKIVELYDSAKDADRARDHFVKVFQEGENPQDMDEVEVAEGVGLIDVMRENELVKSGGEARRLIEQGGVRLDEEKVVDVNLSLDEKGEYVLQVGKRKFLKILVK
jgi:tyrosyl-tRNA synthetase